MITKKCLFCKKIIFLSKLKDKWTFNKQKYCSRKCFGLAKRKLIIKYCLTCNKEFKTYLSYDKHNKGKYCSRKCFYKSTVGKRNRNWKGGRIKDKNGYIYISNNNHPFKNSSNRIFEHRLVVEKCIGRYLTKQEVVHHINEIKDDNRPENLYLFKNDKEHHHIAHNSKNIHKLTSNIKTQQ